jgi:stage II sporulation protein AA (anti-sigma F factor antagonist)
VTGGERRALSVQGRSRIEKAPVLVSFSGELDAGDSALAEELARTVETGADRVIVDLLNVTFVDSSIIRSLVLAHRQVASVEGWVRVVYTHHVVRRVIEMCGLTDIFPQYPTVEAAWRDDVVPPPNGEAAVHQRQCS